MNLKMSIYEQWGQEMHCTPYKRYIEDFKGSMLHKEMEFPKKPDKIIYINVIQVNNSNNPNMKSNAMKL